MTSLALKKLLSKDLEIYSFCEFIFGRHAITYHVHVTCMSHARTRCHVDSFQALGTKQAIVLAGENLYTHSCTDLFVSVAHLSCDCHVTVIM